MEKKKLSFSGVMLIYVIVMITVLFVALAFMWRWLDRLENSRGDSVMEHYMLDCLEEDLEAGIVTYSIAHQAGFQKAEEISSVLAVALGSDDWGFEQNRSLSKDDCCVYDLVCGDIVVGKATLEAEAPVSIDMGLDGWESPEVEFDFSVFGKSITVLAPYGCEVLLSGEAVSEDLVVESIGLYPQLEAYEEVISEPNQLLLYEIGDIYAEVAVETGTGYTMHKGAQEGEYYALPTCEADLAEDLIDYCKDRKSVV